MNVELNRCDDMLVRNCPFRAWFVMDVMDVMCGIAVLRYCGIAAIQLLLGLLGLVS